MRYVHCLVMDKTGHTKWIDIAWGKHAVDGLRYLGYTVLYSEVKEG